MFQVPPLLWQDQVKLLGLAVSFLTSTMLNILALKVEEAGKVALVDKCSSIIVAFGSQVVPTLTNMSQLGNFLSVCHSDSQIITIL